MTKLIGDPAVPLEATDGDAPPRRTGALVALGLSTGAFVVLLPFSPLGAALSGLPLTIALSAAAVFGPPRLARFLGAAPLVFSLGAAAWALFCASWLADHG